MNTTLPIKTTFSNLPCAATACLALALPASASNRWWDGSTETKTATALVYDPEGLNHISGPTPVGGGQYAISFAGIPGFYYALDQSSSLTPPIPWSPVATNTASGTGLVTFTFTPANPSGYFRTRYVA